MMQLVKDGAGAVAS